MKKFIGIALIILFLVAFWVGMSFVLYRGGVSLSWSIIIPSLCYIATVLVDAFCRLIAWLLT